MKAEDQIARPSPLGGATLIELVVAVVVIAIALSGALMLSQSTTARSADPMIEHQALAIADAYLEEILLQPYRDPDDASLCGAAESARDVYDDVCDYDGLDDAGAHDQLGAAVPGLGDYRVEVDVDSSASLGGLSGASEVLRIDVRVSHPQGIAIMLSGYRTPE